MPKNRIVLSGKASRRVRDQLTAQVARIVWANKLAPETLKLPATKAVPEIQIFRLVLKPAGIGDALPVDILRCIDRAIGFPLIFELTASREDGSAQRSDPRGCHLQAAQRGRSRPMGGRRLLRHRLAAGRHAAAPLPVALDMARLYEQMLRQLIPLPARDGESIAAWPSGSASSPPSSANAGGSKADSIARNNSTAKSSSTASIGN